MGQDPVYRRQPLSDMRFKVSIRGWKDKEQDTCQSRRPDGQRICQRNPNKTRYHPYPRGLVARRPPAPWTGHRTGKQHVGTVPGRKPRKRTGPERPFTGQDGDTTGRTVCFGGPAKVRQRASGGDNKVHRSGGNMGTRPAPTDHIERKSLIWEETIHSSSVITHEGLTTLAHHRIGFTIDSGIAGMWNHRSLRSP